MALDASSLKGPPRLALNDTHAVRRSLTRLLRERFRGTLDSQTFRDLFYGANTLLGYDRLIADSRIETRLDEIEKAIAEQARARLNSAPEPRPGLPPAPVVSLSAVTEAPSLYAVVQAVEQIETTPPAPAKGKLKL